ncbi:DMT family transporter [Rhodospirillum centenum]|uniref:Integral membrane protein, putative n=1 Tax=Rhodospirillum centenum (strain ATCC 51521 / SW) TaxID=414684 RepID=B6IN18_RHOCS|nr:DMT family transporter [Rhodospirillum centenum]ACI98915.1 integral membrane protein, putative [Rhodospirillum centenum SW]
MMRVAEGHVGGTPLARAERRALMLLALGTAAIALSPIFFRLSEIGPIASAFWRVTLALPLLGLWRVAEIKRNGGAGSPRNLRDWAGLFAAGLFFAGDLAFWHWSLTHTTVANATLFANSAPVFVTLVGWLFFRRRFSPRFLLGLTGALAGAGLLIGASVQIGPDHVVGDGLGMVTAMFLAGYLITVERLRMRFSTATIMVWSAVAGALSLLLLALATEPVLVPHTATGWLVLLGLAVISHAGGQSLIAYSMAHLPVAFTSVSLLLQPLLAAIFAAVLLGEAIGGLQVAGGIVILAGIVLARQGSR